ncbi:the ARF-like 2 binding protein BART-domain-containing protein, partial [Catenaria anguillulae PL171]
MSLARQSSSKSSIEVPLPTAQSDETIQSVHDSDALRFDLVIGEIESILMDPDFTQRQDAFFAANYHHFEDRDENSLACMDVFRNYVTMMERSLESHLSSRFAWFKMTDFMTLCRRFIDQGSQDANGDVFEVLASLSDFNSFKELMLSYRAEREGQAPDLSGLITMTSMSH